MLPWRFHAAGRSGGVVQRAIVLTTLLSYSLGGAVPPDQGEYCPIIPQARTAITAPVPPTDGILDLTGERPKASVQMRVANARPSDLVVIDGATLRDPLSLQSIRTSKAVIMLKTAHPGEEARSLLGRQVSTVAVIAALPKDESGVAGMYRKTTAVPAVVQEYKRTAAAFEKLPNTRVMSAAIGAVSIRDTVLAEARAKRPNDLLVVVAHNEKGELKFPDRSRVTTEEIASANAQSNRPLLVLSCETLATEPALAAFVTTRALRFDEIQTAVRAGFALFDHGNSSVRMADVVREMNTGLAAEGKERQHKIAIALVATAALATAMVATDPCALHLKADCN
jgi:hypothetical protein